MFKNEITEQFHKQSRVVVTSLSSIAFEPVFEF